MVYNILVFSLLLLIIFFRFIGNQKTSKNILFLFMCAVILISISALRYTPYGDFYNNYRAFIKVINMNWKEIFSYTEFGHQLFRKFISIFTDNPQWYFALSSFFIIISFLIFLYRYSPNIYISVFLFVTLGYYFEAHNVTSQYISIAMCLYAIPYLINRKFLWFIIIVLIAITLHTSAIVFIPLYFIAQIKITKKVILAYLVLIGLSQLLFTQLLRLVQHHLYTIYTSESWGMTSSNKLGIILPCLLVIICVFGYEIRSKELYIDSTESYVSAITLKNNNRLNDVITHMGLISFMCSLLSVTKILLMDRIGYYFSVSYLILVPLTFTGFKKGNKILFNTFIIILAIIYFLIYHFTGRLSPSPYTPFWQY